MHLHINMRQHMNIQDENLVRHPQCRSGVALRVVMRPIESTPFSRQSLFFLDGLP